VGISRAAFPDLKFYKSLLPIGGFIGLPGRNGAERVRGMSERALKHRKSKAWKVWESCAEKIADFVSH